MEAGDAGGMSGLQNEFESSLQRLKTWYADSVKAQSFDGPSISHTKPGAVQFRVQSYPHETYWRSRWSLAKGEGGRREVVEELEREFRELSTSPSKKHRYVLNTLEWKAAIACEEGSSAHVARLWCVAPSTVRKYRKLHG